MAAGKKEEAKKMLAEFLDEQNDSKAEGAALLDYSMIYMAVMNELNEAYKAQLDEILAELKELDKSQKETGEKIKLASVRADLK